MIKKRVSMKDIAQRLGISTALVSYVLNGKLSDRINKATASLVKDTAKEMGYQPNLLAKSLRNSKSYTIGLILADIANPFSAHLARIIEDEAKKSEYTVIFGSADESHLKFNDLVQTFLSRQVDGFIIAAVEGAEELLRSLKEQNIPCVLIDRYFSGIEMNAVTTNNYQVSYDGIMKLRQNGFNRIGMLHLKSSLTPMTERVRGYQDAVSKDNTYTGDRYLIGIDEPDLKLQVVSAIDQLVSRDEPVDALFFASNLLAMEGLIHIRNLNLRVPEDIGILCFDQSAAYNLFYCPLSYIEQPINEIGEQAVTILLNSIDNSELPVQDLVLESRLVMERSALKTS
ncbi:LacI family DNA-binding transcriptional regulator [Pedobacter sp. BAL39]|uniref:LacI family DNA-binding transcriptional regulator n=1 Tax=Pedobacter sp. BAL39 TaxID=391596 RepID=UPI000586A39B|nr:substrate-binding domain-containing protein [Pedobacter sp. BAL39]